MKYNQIIVPLQYAMFIVVVVLGVCVGDKHRSQPPFQSYRDGQLSCAKLFLDRLFNTVQLLSKFFIDSDFCHNYLHTLYLFACLL